MDNFAISETFNQRHAEVGGMGGGGDAILHFLPEPSAELTNLHER